VHPQSVHVPVTDNLDKSGARNRHTTQYRVRTAYAHSPIMLALDRRIFDIPLEERLQSRISDPVAWITTMFPVIRHRKEPSPLVTTSIDICRSRHHNIRTYLSTKASAVTTTKNCDASHHGRTDHFHSQSIPSLVYAPFATDYSNHEPRRHKPPRKNRPPPQSLPSLVYAPFTIDSSKHEPSQIRLQLTLGGSFRGAIVPVEFNEVSLTT
jgi:hypothetical protein